MNPKVQITLTATLTRVVTVPKDDQNEIYPENYDEDFDDAVESAGWELVKIVETVREEIDADDD